MKNVLFFSSPTCPGCKAVLKYWGNIIKEYEYEYFYIDTSLSLEEAKKYHVMRLPTILIENGGKELARIEGTIMRYDLNIFLKNNQ
jgi:thiol-disulfide isomerase/thioredoxin